MNTELRFLEAAELRVVETPGQPMPKIVGHAAVFNKLSKPLGSDRVKFREKILPGAFKRVLATNPDVRATIYHDRQMMLGRTKAGTLELREDGVGLYFEITPPNTSIGRDAVEQVRRGDIDGASFAFAQPKDEWQRSGDENVRTISEFGIIKDVTLTPDPAYDDTSVDLRHCEESIKNLETRQTVMIPAPPAAQFDDGTIRYCCENIRQTARSLFDGINRANAWIAANPDGLTDQDKQSIADMMDELGDLEDKIEQAEEAFGDFYDAEDEPEDPEEGREQKSMRRKMMLQAASSGLRTAPLKDGRGVEPKKGAA